MYNRATHSTNQPKVGLRRTEPTPSHVHVHRQFRPGQPARLDMPIIIATIYATGFCSHLTSHFRQHQTIRLPNYAHTATQLPSSEAAALSFLRRTCQCSIAISAQLDQDAEQHDWACHCRDLQTPPDLAWINNTMLTHLPTHAGAARTSTSKERARTTQNSNSNKIMAPKTKKNTDKKIRHARTHPEGTPTWR